jgi:SAM-dependent methyltransferase
MFSGDRLCRICGTHAAVIFEDRRPFFVCNKCGFIFTNCLLTHEEITRHYLSQYEVVFDWENEAKAILNLVNFAVSPNKLLDFGSGSGKLADTFRSMGIEVDTYEPMLQGNFKSENYSNNYDMVIFNEVIEHIENVVEVFNNVAPCIKQGGVIYICTVMTDAIINEPDRFNERFNSWWYKNDPTHISFFCQLTFEYICTMEKNYRLQIVAIGPNCLLLQRL